MRRLAYSKVLLSTVVIALMLTAPIGPAFGKERKKSGSFEARGVPFPFTAECGIEGINKTTQSLRAPFTGILQVTLKGFTGDWDLYVIDADGTELAAGYESQISGAPPVEKVVIKIKKGSEIGMYGCNYVGGPTAVVTWELKATD